MKKKSKITLNPWVNLERAYEVALLGGYTVTPVSNEPIYEDFNTFAKPTLQGILHENGDMFVELSPLQRDNLDIEVSFHVNMEKIEALKNTPNPDEYVDEKKCMGFLKTIQERMNFSEVQLKRIEKIAATIAKLDDSKAIELNHIAEAIHYQMVINKDTEYYNLLEPDHIYIEGVKIPKKLLNSHYELSQLIEKLNEYIK
jgi:hypothetical protein